MQESARLHKVSWHTKGLRLNPPLWGEFKLANSRVVESHTQLSRPIPSRHFICMEPRLRMIQTKFKFKFGFEFKFRRFQKTKRWAKHKTESRKSKNERFNKITSRNGAPREPNGSREVPQTLTQQKTFQRMPPIAGPAPKPETKKLIKPVDFSIFWVRPELAFLRFGETYRKKDSIKETPSNQFETIETNVYW